MAVSLPPEHEAAAATTAAAAFVALWVQAMYVAQRKQSRKPRGSAKQSRPNGLTRCKIPPTHPAPVQVVGAHVSTRMWFSCKYRGSSEHSGTHAVGNSWASWIQSDYIEFVLHVPFSFKKRITGHLVGADLMVRFRFQSRIINESESSWIKDRIRLFQTNKNQKRGLIIHSAVLPRIGWVKY